MGKIYVITMIAIMAIITILLRVLPFVIFSKKETPKYIIYLGKYLPFAIIGMLVVYCLKDTTILSFPYGIPEIISVTLVAVLHLWKKNTLLSIVPGTICYMILIQLMTK